jgi:hypothetical protein
MIDVEGILVIYDKYKCIHVHIPKTGGTSIAHAFRGTWIDPFDKINRVHEGHATACEIKKYYATEEQWNNYFKFAIVRNPFERVASAYNFLVGGTMKKSRFENRVEFRSFVTRTNFYNKMLSSENKSAERSFNYIVKPAVDYLFEDDNLLVDYIGRFENLEEEWEIICEKLKIKMELPHKRRYHHKYYKEFYDEATKRIVAKTYKKDIEIFGYEF